MVYAGANTGGTDLISCQNVTHNALDYCCDHTTDCCGTGVGRFQLSGTGVAYTTIGSSASTATQHLSATTSSVETTTSSSQTSSTPLPASTTASLPSATSTSSSGLGTGAKIGIAVGVSAGVIIIIVLSGSLWWHLRKKAPSKQEVAFSEDSTPVSETQPLDAGTHTRMQELPTDMAWEMAGDRAGELPSVMLELMVSVTGWSKRILYMYMFIASNGSTSRARFRMQGAQNLLSLD